MLHLKGLFTISIYRLVYTGDAIETSLRRTLRKALLLKMQFYPNSSKPIKS